MSGLQVCHGRRGRKAVFILSLMAIIVPASPASAQMFCKTGSDASTQFVDVTGDGRADAIVINESGITVRRSTGSFFSGNESWTEGAYYGQYGTYFADVTGDRRADAIVVNPDGVTVRRSSGQGFLPNETWAEAYYGNLTPSNYFADVTGDGLADAIVINGGPGGGITIRRSDGSRFLPNETWSPAALVGVKGTYFADLDGDRRADLVISDASTVSAVLSNDGFHSALRPISMIGYYGSHTTRYADVTGDGRADGIVVNGDRVTVRRGNGKRDMAGNEAWTEGPYYGDVGDYFADVTGDGRADAIVVNRSGVTVRRSDGIRFLPNETWTDNPYYGSRNLC